MKTVEMLDFKSKSNEETSKVTMGQKMKQPRFFCSNCRREIFMRMAYCDECGGEIAWQEKYKVIAAKKKVPKEAAD
jgi:rRNA maturation endonuclease Nob1